MIRTKSIHTGAEDFPANPVLDAAIREALTEFLAMKPILTMEKKSLVIAGDIALLIVKATLLGKGRDNAQVQIEHTSSDVLRRQVDGRWLFVIDNPWGARILECEPRHGSG